MPAPSLVDSCTKACIKNVRNIEDIGSCAYFLIRPILLRITSPTQLRKLELLSPHLLGEDAELWRAFIAREIPNWRTKNYAPKNPTKWYEIYVKYKKEQAREIARDEEVLRQSMMGLSREKAGNVSQVLDLRALPKVPRDPRMVANNGGVPIKGRGGFKKEDNGRLSWTSGSKTKMTDGKSVLVRARREAKEISQMGKLSRPTHQLAMGQVAKAPKGMATEYKIAAQPAVKILSRRHQMSRDQTLTGGITGPSLEEREKRLRAAMGGGKHTMVGSSDEDNNSDIDDTDLFDEPVSRPRPLPVSSSSSRPNRKAKPSDLTSSTSKPRQRLYSSPPPERRSSPPVSRTSTPTPGASRPTIPPVSRTSTPTPGPGAGNGRPMMPKRKQEVDIFNRGPKRRRV